eukprot:1892220-Pyramimonas_sp.AAC.1
MPDGSPWKEGLNEDHSYDDVAAHAKQTLFNNKLGKTINGALVAYRDAVDKARQTARKFEFGGVLSECVGGFKEMLVSATTAVSEAALVQLLKKPAEAVKDDLRKELGAVADRGVSANRILRQILEKAQEAKNA